VHSYKWAVSAGGVMEKGLGVCSWGSGMIFDEAFEFMFASETELFHLFFGEERSDMIYFSLKHFLKSQSPQQPSHEQDSGCRKSWLTLELDGEKSSPLYRINDLSNELQFIFQTNVKRTEIAYLQDGQDFCPFKRTQGHFAFACLFGASREISLKNRSSKKIRRFRLNHGDVLYLSEQISKSHAKGILRQCNDATSDSIVLLFHCDRPFTADL